jgi:hypothetical protein
MIILKLILQKKCVVDCMHHTELDPVAKSCDHEKKLPVSVKQENLLAS